MARRGKNKRPPRFPQVDGVLVLNKPSGPTSTDCLNQIKRECDQRKIGHAGTLDPLAQGVLLVMLGKATKIGPYLMGSNKTYQGGLRVGMSTDTYDIQGEVVSEHDISDLDPETVRQTILDWTEIKVQEVPAYSAAKHQGKPLYALARAGEETPVKMKDVTILEATPLSIDLPEAEFRVTCSAGTYIRSLVHSLGNRIGCGATMTSLVRESSGSFSLDNAFELEDVLANPEGLAEKVIGLGEALPDWPKAVLSEEMTARVQNGVRLKAESNVNPGARVFFLDQDETPLALAESIEDRGRVVWSIIRGLW